MGIDVRSIARRIRVLYRDRTNLQFWSSLVVKLAFVVVGSLVAAVAQFAVAGDKPNAWTYIGISAAIVAGIGGLYVAVTDHNSFDELEEAHSALEAAKDLEAEVKSLADASSEDWEDYERELNRAIDLYTAMDRMRTVIEAALANPKDELITIKTLIDASRRELLLALGFKMREQWTVSVFKAEPHPEGGVHLVCKVAARSIDCDVTLARKWPEGVGIAGAAYSRNSEIVVEDVTDPALGTLYNLAERANANDDKIYRSIVAVPIAVLDGGHPWGVVVATSDQPGKFDPDEHPGLRTVTAARALAGMAELAIKMHHALRRDGNAPNLVVNTQ